MRDKARAELMQRKANEKERNGSGLLSQTQHTSTSSLMSISGEKESDNKPVAARPFKEMMKSVMKVNPSTPEAYPLNYDP